MICIIVRDLIEVSLIKIYNTNNKLSLLEDILDFFAYLLLIYI